MNLTRTRCMTGDMGPVGFAIKGTIGQVKEKFKIYDNIHSGIPAWKLIKRQKRKIRVNNSEIEYIARVIFYYKKIVKLSIKICNKFHVPKDINKIIIKMIDPNCLSDILIY